MTHGSFKSCRSDQLSLHNLVMGNDMGHETSLGASAFAALRVAHGALKRTRTVITRFRAVATQRPQLAAFQRMGAGGRVRVSGPRSIEETLMFFAQPHGA
jgi:hypothetical protein